jgi:preprotein translocase subunit SecG
MTSRAVRFQIMAAVAWSAALIPGALVLPIANTQRSASQLRAGLHDWSSLTQSSGPGILWIPIVTLALALVVAYLLERQARSNGLGPSRVASGIGAIVAAGALVGTVTFLIGVFLVPSAVLILLASGEARHNARSSVPRAQISSGLTSACGHKNDALARYCTSCGEFLMGSDRSTT